MKLELIRDEYEPCTPKIFTIDGIDADPDDFGEIEKVSGCYCCESRKFIGFEEVPESTLEKYHITESEFFDICDELRDVLEVEHCSRCA